MYFGGFYLVFKRNGPVKFLWSASGYPNIRKTKLGAQFLCFEILYNIIPTFF